MLDHQSETRTKPVELDQRRESSAQGVVAVSKPEMSPFQCVERAASLPNGELQKSAFEGTRWRDYSKQIAGMARTLSKVVGTAPVSTDHATQPPSVTSRYFRSSPGQTLRASPKCLRQCDQCPTDAACISKSNRERRNQRTPIGPIKTRAS
jgi:hypothetical protein